MSAPQGEQLTITLQFETDEGLPLEFLALTSKDLRQLIATIAEARYGPAHRGEWTIETDELRVVAHVNGATADELQSIIIDTYDGFSAIEAAAGGEFPSSFNNKAKKLANTIVHRVKKTAPATVNAANRAPLEIGPDEKPADRTGRRQRYAAWASIDGELDVISVRGRPHFVIHEHGTNAAVRCTFPDDWMQKIKDLLGRRVLVEGYVRYRVDGRPSRLVNPKSLDPVLKSETDIKALRGSLPGITAGLSAYEYVRRIREGDPT